MPRKRKHGRLYLKGGRWYGDFRDLGGRLEALRPPGEQLATTDGDIAAALASGRVKELESIRRGVAILGRGREESLGSFAQHHLERRARLGEVTDGTIARDEKYLARAIEFFGAGRLLTSIDLAALQDWAEWLRTRGRGRRGNATLSAGTVRHHLNALSGLYRMAINERKVPLGFNPVGAWDRKPKGRPREARWLEPHEASLLMEAARAYRNVEERQAIPDLHALVATHLLTGGRPAEVRGLAVADVNFNRTTVTFRPHEWRRLKTETSHRVVPLWPQLQEILRGYLAGPNAPTGELLFPSRHLRVRGLDDELMITDFRGALDDVAAAAGWKAGEIRSYAFRHTY